MHNDLGSVARDRLENNLNSLDFPEHHKTEETAQDQTLKDRLMWLSAYERKCLNLTLQDLKVIGGELQVRLMILFIYVTDMFGQMYLEKDIASRMK